jgi:DNA-binding CsgD family transcriptional regulator/tetratricopeptide (TPR) repeat protein
MDLLERDHCFKQLSALLHLATTGQGRTVLISGEAGIGKTALVEQFVSQQGRAATRLWGACEALFTPRPLGPLYDLATQVRGRLPELLAGNAERATLFSALLEELQKSPVPTIVVFEDVHWADEATLDLIKFLGRRLPHLPALFLITYREPEVNPDHPLRVVIGDLPGQAVARLPLTPLSEHAVTLLAQQAGRPAEGLYTVTGGNPFFVTEILASDTLGVPLMVRDAVLARMARLSAEARMLLELVSVVPARTERWLLSAILCSPEEALVECLTCGMLSLDHTTVAFRHELARQAVESTLSPLRRQTLHAQVLGALGNRGEDPSQAARLVHHALGADDSVLAARYAVLAARQASAQGAHREAAAHYATALGSANQFALEQQAELLEGRAYECYLTGQIEEAIEARHAALEIWRKLNRLDQVGQTMRCLSRLYWFLGKTCEAQHYADEAVELLETLPPTSKLAMAYSNRAQLFLVADNTAEAVRWGERAIALAEELGDSETLVHALNNVGTALFTGTDERGRAHLERSLQLSQERGWEEHVARAYTNLACGAIGGRNYSLAERFLQDGLAYCTEHDLDAWGTYTRAWLGQARFERGTWDDAVLEATRVLDHYPLTVASKIPALVVLGWVRVRRGDPGSTPILDEALKLALTTEEIQRIAPVATVRAEAAWLHGDLVQCLAEAQMGYDLGLKYLDPWRLGPLAFWMWRAGGLTSVPLPIAEPFARQIKGDWQGAAELWAQIGCPYEQALALADGDTEAMLKALALLEQLGARPAAALVRSRLRKLGVAGLPRGPRPSTRTNRAGLTSRQQEVLRLMAEGCSNAEIASRLFTSPRTIDHHVSAILTKLGVHSRAQAIHAAFHQELFPTPLD